tara:strand:+ start:228 stop:560 length:333 start_codon:yes stop_codon:yes gene_type:complete
VKFDSSDKKNFPKYVLALASEYFTEEENKKIKKTIAVASVYEYDAFLRIWEGLTQIMWNYEACVTEGFHSFLYSRIERYKEAFEYHDENCDDKCKLCEVLTCVEKKECLT